MAPPGPLAYGANDRTPPDGAIAEFSGVQSCFWGVAGTMLSRSAAGMQGFLPQILLRLGLHWAFRASYLIPKVLQGTFVGGWTPVVVGVGGMREERLTRPSCWYHRRVFYFTGGFLDSLFILDLLTR